MPPHWDRGNTSAFDLQHIMDLVDVTKLGSPVTSCVHGLQGILSVVVCVPQSLPLEHCPSKRGVSGRIKGLSRDTVYVSCY